MKSSSKYLFYNEQGEVKMIYYQQPPASEMDNWAGMVVYDKEIEKDGYRTKIYVDLETKEVNIDYIEIQEEKSEIDELKDQISVLSDTLDFIIGQGGIM